MNPDSTSQPTLRLSSQTPMMKRGIGMTHAPASTPLILINVVLLSDDGDEDYDAEQLMYCNALPRVGERLVPQSGELGEVVRIEHRAVKVGPQLEHPALLPIVILKPINKRPSSPST